MSIHKEHATKKRNGINAVFNTIKGSGLTANVTTDLILNALAYNTIA